MGTTSFFDSFTGVKNIGSSSRDVHPQPSPPRSDAATAHASPSGLCQTVHPHVR